MFDAHHRRARAPGRGSAGRAMATMATTTTTTTAMATAMTMGVRHGRGARRGATRRGGGARVQARDRTTEDAIVALQELAKGQWNVGEYKSKRREHMTTDLGDIIGEEDALENIAEQPGWDEEGKLMFCVRVVSDELGLDEAECGKRLAHLFKLAPGLERRVLDREVRMADIVRMAANVPDVALAMVRLKDILPESDLSKLVANKPSILLEDPAIIKHKVGELRKKCPKLRWDLILSDFTQLWDIKNPVECVELLQEKLDMNEDQVQSLLGQRPTMLLSVQSRHDMIPYDNGTLAQLQATLSGDKFSDGW